MTTPRAAGTPHGAAGGSSPIGTSRNGREVPALRPGEGVPIALVVVVILVVGLAVVFSSPDDKPVTVKSWSTANPVDFAQTAITELDGTVRIATYGPPYNTGTPQSIGPFSPAKWFGVHHPIDTANDFVIGPLRTLPNQPALDCGRRPVHLGPRRPTGKWTAAYEKAVANAALRHGGAPRPGRRLRASRHR